MKKTYGSRTYPVEYTFDSQGRMLTMKTWQNYAGNSGTATTTWNYDGYRGFMTNKVYADNTKPGYRYTPAGRLYQRIWARGTTTTYATNSAGDVASIDYSDSTPDVTYSYDRLGRRTNIVDGAGTHVLGYSLSGLLLSETNTAGVLAGIAVTNRYDSLNRRTALGLSSDANALVQYGYDTASRLIGVTNGVNTASYSYVANSPLVSQIDFKNSGTARMTTTKSYDLLNRTTAITNLPSADSTVAFNYANNNANQRNSITNADGSRWVYEYDSLGQVTSGKKYWSDGTLVLGQQFEYTFDDIGNRKTAVSGGDVNGRNKRTQSYSVNSLNQYTNRAIPGYLDVIGTATNTATVTVNNLPSSRKTDYYRTEVPVSNSGNAVWQSITNVAVLASGTNDFVTNWTGNLFVPKITEAFGYDADGNQTNDGRWTLTWDGENRLIQMQSLTGAPIGSSNRLTFVYDQQGRRISKVTEVFTGGAWSITLSNRFIYDGWNLLAELNATNNAVIKSFVWGLDLSGSLHGAGGVGGLLVVNATNAGNHFCGYDGNGNVALLVSASSGAATATYEYDPFGNVLRATGPTASLNPFHFSTKYTDGESAFYYYGYRSYNSQAGRWVSRDPIAERGGRDLYGFGGNNSVTFHDRNGLDYVPKLPPYLPPDTPPIIPPSGPTPTPPSTPPVITSPQTPPKPPLGYVCCRTVDVQPTDGWCTRKCGKLFRHCDLSFTDHQSGLCDSGEQSYATEIRSDGSLDTGLACANATLDDIRECLKRNRYSAGETIPGSNCQSNTRERLGKCCLKAPSWDPNWYAYPLPEGPNYPTF